VRLAREKRTWGYDRIVGALRHVGYTISNQTVGNIGSVPKLLKFPSDFALLVYPPIDTWKCAMRVL